MKILIVGSDHCFAIENFYCKYFLEQGVDVRRFTPSTYFYNFYKKSLINKILFRAGLSSIYTKINTMLLAHVEKETPDVIWVFKGMEIMPRTLRFLRQKGIYLVNFNGDNPFIFSGKGSGNKNITHSIGLYHLHFTYNTAVKRRLERDFKNVKTHYLAFGFEVDQKTIEEAEKETEVLRTCFLGNPDKQRAIFIQQLANAGLEIDVFGNGWKSYVQHKLIKTNDEISGEDAWRVLRRYRVQLNLMRIHNLDSHNMRTFEVPGIGGIMVAPNTPEHRMFFRDGEEVFLFADFSDCVIKIQNLINLSKADAAGIRKKAREKAIHAGYTYRDRAQEALNVITSEFQKK
jgi:spore maturation protein CgeB